MYIFATKKQNKKRERRENTSIITTLDQEKMTASSPWAPTYHNSPGFPGGTHPCDVHLLYLVLLNMNEYTKISVLNFYKNGSILLYLTSLAPCMFVKCIHVAYSFTVQQDIPFYMHVWVLSYVRLFATSWTLARQGSSVHGIFQARYTGMGCHFLLQGIFPTQG